MKVEIEDFNTGWFGLVIGIKNSEIDQLINTLKEMKESNGHFHLRSDYDGSGGVGDIEFYSQDEKEKNNMELDYSPAIYKK
jgi:hypothetical protein